MASYFQDDQHASVTAGTDGKAAGPTQGQGVTGVEPARGGPEEDDDDDDDDDEDEDKVVETSPCERYQMWRTCVQ